MVGFYPKDAVSAFQADRKNCFSWNLAVTAVNHLNQQPGSGGPCIKLFYAHCCEAGRNEIQERHVVEAGHREIARATEPPHLQCIVAPERKPIVSGDDSGELFCRMEK